MVSKMVLVSLTLTGSSIATVKWCNTQWQHRQKKLEKVLLAIWYAVYWYYCVYVCSRFRVRGRDEKKSVPEINCGDVYWLFPTSPPLLSALCLPLAFLSALGWLCCSFLRDFRGCWNSEETAACSSFYTSVCCQESSHTLVSCSLVISYR